MKIEIDNNEFKVHKVSQAFFEKNADDFLRIGKSVFGEAAWTIEQYMKPYQGKWDLSCAAMADTKVVGFRIVTIYQMQGMRIAHGNLMAVDPQYQGQGIGNIIIGYSHSLCFEQGVHAITSEVNKEVSPGIGGLYARNGYLQVTEIGHLTTYLNVKGKIALLDKYRAGTASLFIASISDSNIDAQ